MTHSARPTPARSPRRRRLRARAGIGVLAVLALAGLAAGCGPSAAPPPSAPPDAISSTVLNRTNADRGARGLPALSWNDQLAGLAGEWSAHLAATRQFRHRDLAAALDLPGFEGYAALGENILVGPANIDGNQMHDAWMRSPTHYANIVGSWDSMGVGYTVGSDGNVRAVVNFGRSY